MSWFSKIMGGKPRLVPAIEEGDLAKGGRLVRDGADVSAVDRKAEMTPLVAAVLVQSREIMDVLIGAGADLDVRQEGGLTALDYALHDNDEIAMLLLERGATPSAGALATAAGAGLLGACGALLEHGVDVNEADEFGRTALIAACANGEVEFARSLLDAGADPRARDEDGESALSALVSRAGGWGFQDQVAGAVGEHSGGGLRGLSAMIESVVEIGQAADAQTEARLPEGYLELLRGLIACGADVAAKDDSGCTPLLFAVTAKLPAEVVKLLLEAGADPDAADRDGATARAAAADHPNAKVRALF